MKILFISKYPPIQGGVSSRSYWLAKALGERGFEVHVVTNALNVEKKYAENMGPDFDSDKNHIPKNVFLHSTEGRSPWHIPRSPAYLTRLITLGLNVLQENKIDVIYSHYLEPYGGAGFVLKKISGLPLIVRHAGSDVSRLMPHKEFNAFYKEIFKAADRLVLGKNTLKIAERLGIDNKKIILTSHSINENEFSDIGEEFDLKKAGLDLPAGIPLITYIGKASTSKNISTFLEAMSGIREDFKFLMITNAEDYALFQQKIDLFGLKEKILFMEFVPPWIIPLIMRRSSAVIHLEQKFSVRRHQPVIPREAICCGTPVILSGEVFEKIKDAFSQSEKNFLVAGDASNTRDLGIVLKTFLADPQGFKEKAKKIREEFLKSNRWDSYVDIYVKTFSELCK